MQLPRRRSKTIELVGVPLPPSTSDFSYPALDVSYYAALDNGGGSSPYCNYPAPPHSTSTAQTPRLKFAIEPTRKPALHGVRHLKRPVELAWRRAPFSAACWTWIGLNNILFGNLDAARGSAFNTHRLAITWLFPYFRLDAPFSVNLSPPLGYSQTASDSVQLDVRNCGADPARHNMHWAGTAQRQSPDQDRSASRQRRRFDGYHIHIHAWGMWDVWDVSVEGQEGQEAFDC
ncbi:hypothetical protein FB451DRAFT_1185356 [Mycena latifolia]|nr:hypothetical protein FB451DRAFT_1185356 [Mycena latifolia]